MKKKQKVKEPEIKPDRKQKFIELMASGKDAFNSCVEAGYSPKYAKTNAHKLRDKYEFQIKKLKPIMQQAIQEKFKYTIQASFQKLQEIQALALEKDDKGNYQNLTAAIKAEELKGKMYGVYEADNSQKAPERLQIKVITKDNNSDD